MANEATKVITGEVRMSFVHLTKPYAFQPGQDEKYSVTCILPKSDVQTKALLDAAIAAAEQLGVANKWNGVKPPIVPNPVWDGDGVKQDGTPFGPECKGCWVFSASARPDMFSPANNIVGADGQPIMMASDLYSGMYGRVQIGAFPYASNGKKGIGFGLNNVQKLRDGDPLGTSNASAASVFGAAAPVPVPQAPAQAPVYAQPVAPAPVAPTVDFITGQPIG